MHRYTVQFGEYYMVSNRAPVDLLITLLPILLELVHCDTAQYGFRYNYAAILVYFFGFEKIAEKIQFRLLVTV